MMREKIIEKLKYLRDSLELHNFYIGSSGVKMPEGATVQPFVRVNFILSGVKQLTLPFADGPVDLTLTTGDGYYNLPDAWEKYEWDTDHEMICIIPRVNYLRVSYYKSKELEPATREREYYHTGRPYSDAFKKTLDALKTSNRQAVKYLAKALICFAIEECELPPLTSQNGKAAYTFDKIRSWLEHNMQDDINRNSTAKQFNVSPSYLSQLFKSMCGMGVHEYLTNCRMDFAKTLLAETDLPIYLIAEQCGFSNHVHFGRRFRELNDISPGKYRELQLNRKKRGNP
jgi:AraC-like DNA-binding protein